MIAKSRVLNSTSIFCATFLSLYSLPAFAQDAGTDGRAESASDAEDPDVDEYADEDIIIVSAGRARGSVDTDIPPVLELGEEDVASYGVGSIEELLDAISPQTSSGRGRGGGGRPIVLINGQRISGFRELRNIPPEAIERVQVMPEEVALQFGYRPDQRVVNFILKENFASTEVEVEHAEATRGGLGTSEGELTYTRFRPSGRINASLEYNRSSGLTENERNIVQSTDADSLLGTDPLQGNYRSLVAEGDSLSINTGWNRSLSPGTQVTINLGYDLTRNTSLFGLNGASLDVPATSPFAQSASDTSVTRYFLEPRALTRTANTDTLTANTALNTPMGSWNLSLTGNYTRTNSRTWTDRRYDFGDIQNSVTAGLVDPYAVDLGALLSDSGRDYAQSISNLVETQAVASGSLFEMPAGPVTSSFSVSYSHQDIDSETVQTSGGTAASLGRDTVNGRANLTIPIADDRESVLDFLGSLSLNANAGVSELSDFGTLYEFGGGLTWSPSQSLTLQASFIGEDAAPDLTDLGNPVIVTPNTNVYDFNTGQSVLVSVTTGGNPDLAKEKRRDLKLSAAYDLPILDRSDFRVEYFRNRSFNTTNSFPVLTSEIEAAFPDRVTRDANGSLIALDRRAVTFDTVKSDSVRMGFNLSKRIESPSAESERQGRRGGGGGPPMFGRGRGGGRWNLALNHTIKLKETVLIRDGVPLLDLLKGSAIGSSGAAMHTTELEGGVFYNGFGFRLEGNYQGPSRVDGNEAAGATDLFFGDLLTFDLRLFADLGQRESLVQAVPFFTGSRVSLRVNNLFDTIRDVRNEAGEIPISYQPGYIDPEGRVIELEFRKLF